MYFFIIYLFVARHKHIHALPNTSTVALGKMHAMSSLVEEDLNAIQEYLYSHFQIVVDEFDEFDEILQFERIQTKDKLRFYSTAYIRE